MRFNLSVVGAITLALVMMGCASQTTAEKTEAEKRELAATSRPGESARTSSVRTPAVRTPVVPVAPRTITIPAGTRLAVSLIDSVSTDKSQAGDRFVATLDQPIVIDGTTVVAKGSEVRGKVVEVDDGGRVKGRAYIRLALTELDAKGKSVPIDTKLFG